MKFLFFFVVAVNKLKKKINYNLSEKARDCKNNNKTSVMYLLFCIIIFSFFFRFDDKKQNNNDFRHCYLIRQTYVNYIYNY